MTEEQAIKLYDSGWWEGLPDVAIVSFQLFEPRLCMPFGDFHQAVEACLKRPVWTHEFAHPTSLKKEFLGDRPAPTFEEIVQLIPKEKRVLFMEGT
jgi:hypothetical protein